MTPRRYRANPRSATGGYVTPPQNILLPDAVVPIRFSHQRPETIPTSVLPRANVDYSTIRARLGLNETDMNTLRSLLVGIIQGNPSMLNMNLRQVTQRQELCDYINGYDILFPASIANRLVDHGQVREGVGWLLYQFLLWCMRDFQRAETRSNNSRGSQDDDRDSPSGGSSGVRGPARTNGGYGSPGSPSFQGSGRNHETGWANGLGNFNGGGAFMRRLISGRFHLSDTKTDSDTASLSSPVSLREMAGRGLAVMRRKSTCQTHTSRGTSSTGRRRGGNQSLRSRGRRSISRQSTFDARSFAWSFSVGFLLILLVAFSVSQYIHERSMSERLQNSEGIARARANTISMSREGTQSISPETFHRPRPRTSDDSLLEEIHNLFEPRPPPKRPASKRDSSPKPTKKVRKDT